MVERARVAVLALQGDFEEHCHALRAIGVEPIEARSARDLAGAAGLVLPGGESTAIRTLLERDGGELESAIRALHGEGRPVLATCAGLILIAREVRDPPARSMGLLDVAVARNGWGRQIASAVEIADDGCTPVVLIRAPRIVETGDGVEVLARLRGEPVLVREQNVVAATFHPELAGDLSVHRLAFPSCCDNVPAPASVV